MPSDKQLRGFLRWFITPDDDTTDALFRAHDLSDDWISAMTRIENMSRAELVEECRDVLKEYNLDVDMEDQP